ncbi:MAG: tRNA (adenosine(37)-N6)-threonylcarbamoyltransferase complex transferase subunit TsaD [Clostridia bacterium]|nr:tRNA (adenosine(37)-N6)-threonylcarbamoyltransferase complex transferase subunit TsaD [Clostridia bacterium]
MNILAIESSCDETAAAVVEDGRRVRSDIIASSAELHKLYGGVVPEIASRKHLECISQVTEQALEQAGLSFSEIDAVAVTYGPGLIGALLVGMSYAKAVAFALQKPLIAVHHIKAHLAANYIEHPELKPPFVGLVASGGHSHIVHAADWMEFEVLGKTRDDAAGEAFDKVARTIGLGYPGGPLLEALAKEGNETAYAFPRVAFDNYDFSFSGVKTAVINTMHKAEQTGIPVNRADVAASFQCAAADVLVEHTLAAAREKQVTTVVMAGGVSANSYLRKRFEQACTGEGLSFLCPRPRYCTDNAVMVGCAGYFMAREGQFCSLDENAYATLPF